MQSFCQPHTVHTTSRHLQERSVVRVVGGVITLAFGTIMECGSATYVTVTTVVMVDGAFRQKMW